MAADVNNHHSGLHRHEILLKPQYQRLIIGKIKGEERQIVPLALGAPSTVPYAEPTWLTPAYHSPYYNDSHRRLQREIRAYVDTEITEIAQACEASGKRPDVELVRKMGSDGLNAMRMGPGKHLHGRKLFAGIKGEEFDYFHELIITQVR